MNVPAETLLPLCYSPIPCIKGAAEFERFTKAPVAQSGSGYSATKSTNTLTIALDQAGNIQKLFESIEPVIKPNTREHAFFHESHNNFCGQIDRGIKITNSLGGTISDTGAPDVYIVYFRKKKMDIIDYPKGNK